MWHCQAAPKRTAGYTIESKVLNFNVHCSCLNKRCDNSSPFIKHDRKRSGIMVSILVPGSSGPGLSSGWGYCVVFLGETLYSNSTSLHPGVEMGNGELSGKPNKLRGVTWDWLASQSEGVEILLAASWCRNRDKLRQLWTSRRQGFTFFL